MIIKKVKKGMRYVMKNRDYNRLHRMRKRIKKRNDAHDDRIIEFGKADCSLPRGFYKNPDFGQEFEDREFEDRINPWSGSLGSVLCSKNEFNKQFEKRLG